MPRTARLLLDVFADITGWADAAAPREACGVLFGYRIGDDFEVRYASHGRNVATDPRRFQLDPGHYVHCVDESIATGVDIVGVWHSHPDSGAVPSDQDREAAWPEHLHLIVGPAARHPARVRAWQDGELAVVREDQR